MKLTEELKNKIDNFYNNISPDELYYLSVKHKMVYNMKIKILLRSLRKGETMILETPEGEYISYQCKNTSLAPEGCVEKTIESRLQFELYGEYPLSPLDQTDFDCNIKPLLFRNI